MDLLHIKDAVIPVEFIINNRLKYIRMALTSEGLRVSIPSGLYKRDAEKLLKSKHDWIYEHYIKIKENIGVDKDILKEALYRGESYPVILHETKEKSVKLQFDGREFHLNTPCNISLDDRREAAKKGFHKFYDENARRIIEERLDYYCRIMGVKYNNFRIKEQKTRWGSCSGKGNLNFNLRLAMAPDWVLDYVVVHELCHLKHMDHSKNFWQAVAQYIPEYNKAREYLKKYGASLTI